MLAVLPAAGLCIMTHSRPRIRIAALAAVSVLLMAGAASAQEQRSSGGLLDNLFSRGEQPAPQRPSGEPRVAQADSADVNARIDRIESALRQLTGTIEDLQHQNQMLQMQLKRMQDDTEYRFQQLGSKGGLPPSAQPRAMAPPAPVDSPPAAAPGGRSDVFDPALQPNAPGAPRVLGNGAAAA